MYHGYLKKLSSCLPEEKDKFFEIFKTASILNDLIEEYPDLKEKLELAAKTVKPNHLKWVAKQLNAKEKFEEVIETIQRMIQLKQKMDTDLYKYETLADLREAIENTKNKTKEKYDAKEALVDAERIYESNNYLVVHPLNTAGSVYYGQGTRWCTAATESKNYFEDYAMNNVFLYYIITKNKKLLSEADDPNAKIAYAILANTDADGRVSLSKEIFNKKDKRIQDSDVKLSVKEFGRIYPKIEGHVLRNKRTKFAKSMDTMSIEEFKKIFDSKRELEKIEFCDKLLQTSKNENLIIYILNEGYFHYALPYALLRQGKITENIAKILVNKNFINDDILHNKNITAEAARIIFTNESVLLKLVSSSDLEKILNNDMIVSETIDILIDFYDGGVLALVGHNQGLVKSNLRYFITSPALTDAQFNQVCKLMSEEPTRYKHPSNYISFRKNISNHMAEFAFGAFKERFMEKFKYYDSDKEFSYIEDSLHRFINECYEILFESTNGDVKIGVTKDLVAKIYSEILSVIDSVNATLSEMWQDKYPKDSWFVDHNSFIYLDPFKIYLGMLEPPDY